MVKEEEKEEDFDRAFEELYMDSICTARKNTEFREQHEAINKEKKTLEEKLRYKELELKHSKAREQKLQQHLASKEKDINKMLGGSQKLINMLLQQKRPLCKLGLGAHNHDGEFNKPLNIVKVSIQLGEDFTQEANTSKVSKKGKEPMVVQVKKMPPHAPRQKKSTQVPMGSKMNS